MTEGMALVMGILFLLGLNPRFEYSLDSGAIVGYSTGSADACTCEDDHVFTVEISSARVLIFLSSTSSRSKYSCLFSSLWWAVSAIIFEFNGSD